MPKSNCHTRLRMGSIQCLSDLQEIFDEFEEASALALLPPCGINQWNSDSVNMWLKQNGWRVRLNCTKRMFCTPIIPILSRMAIHIKQKKNMSDWFIWPASSLHLRVTSLSLEPYKKGAGKHQPEPSTEARAGRMIACTHGPRNFSQSCTVIEMFPKMLQNQSVFWNLVFWCMLHSVTFHSFALTCSFYQFLLLSPKLATWTFGNVPPTGVCFSIAAVSCCTWWPYTKEDIGSKNFYFFGI